MAPKTQIIQVITAGAAGRAAIHSRQLLLYSETLGSLPPPQFDHSRRGNIRRIQRDGIVQQRGKGRPVRDRLCQTVVEALQSSYGAVRRRIDVQLNALVGILKVFPQGGNHVIGGLPGKLVLRRIQHTCAAQLVLRGASRFSLPIGADNEDKLMSARYPEPYCLSIY
jgi:hypothetical protein